MIVLQISRLAIDGGTPIFERQWPKWPQSDAETESEVIKVLRSGRWTISGFSNGKPLQEQIFASAFSSFLGAKYCIPTDHGTSALELAMEACDVKPMDEVIVPGLTWVACPYSVLAQQAIPVLADVDPKTMCLDPKSVKQLITSKTKAILVVHLYSRIANMSALCQIAKEHGLTIIEDCAQSHGARWKGKCVGTLGQVGAFSMQQGKPLTAGEGGCCVTNDDDLAERIYRFRTDGRFLAGEDGRTLGRTELLESGHVLSGRNRCLSDIQLAILTIQLKKLKAQNEQRRSNAAYLAQLLQQLPGISIPSYHEPDDEEVYYHFAFFLNETFLRGKTVAWVGEALSAELGTWVHQPYVPLSRHPLYVPEKKAWVQQSESVKSLVDKKRFHLPSSEEVHEKTLLLHHSVLLSPREDMDMIAAALHKIYSGIN
ncbi:MAG: glutamine--scyllo-inositol aminotransferase [Moorea sp. SIO1F2]|uniref:DegT/DnrJ/EryC1/StrS family aminotransferase n=1 Tax=unclassified Moorena TaxID=2683338 RepID=UPI0013BC570D|nr:MULTISPECIES: DegT/DnrJ/EryC1/StrS family aminotransferase [unclassified Moorena]NEN94792.1 glutamine--scyllo-inositol aminotransferase [Moorena sp. SIO3I7]NEO05755.1 glutamine--scyllo-inositol aminotransferase [Moorena sp. SIO3I8]NET83826.1 glutamine--scyllo-inositol aminotransferase [Moorena sp. SIO1F2]